MAEYFDVLDEYGNKTGEVKERNAVHRDGDWHAAINIFIVNSQNEVLQQRRAADKDSYPNMWDLSCGGHVTTGEDYETAAIRELEEELGVTVQPEGLVEIGEFKTNSRPKPDFINNSIERVYLLRRDWKVEDYKVQEEEISGLRYVPWRKLREMLQNPKPDDMLRHRKQYGVLFEILEKEEANSNKAENTL